MFRLPEHHAVINRLGFNNDGVDALVRNVERARHRRGVLGINIGKNKDTPNESRRRRLPATASSACIRCADYVTVNISSPNTAGLRELQEEQALRRLIGTLREAQERLGAQHGKRVPMLVKVAPDLHRRRHRRRRARARRPAGGRRDRHQHHDRRATACEALAARGTKPGGLSGAPLMAQSTAVLRRHAHAAAGIASR